MGEGRTSGDDEDGRETETADTVLLSIEALSTRYDPSDERWVDQVVDLVDQLREDVGGVRRRQEVGPDQKGGVDTLILALGSAGAFQAAVAVFRAWLARDRSRCLRLVITDAKERRHAVEISGDSIDSRTFSAVAEVVARRLPMT